MLFENEGYCSICEGSARFVAEQAWLRDHYVGVKCQSIPRQRAGVWALNLLRPDWKEAVIHESSPTLWFFRERCPRYSFSYYFEDVINPAIIYETVLNCGA